MKKIISFILTMIMLLTCTSISVMASDVQSDTADQDEKMTIGVSVESVSVSKSVLREFRNYFENYVGMAFEVEFLYSSSISTAEEEISFINELHERNVKGIISFSIRSHFKHNQFLLSNPDDP